MNSNDKSKRKLYLILSTYIMFLFFIFLNFKNVSGVVGNIYGILKPFVLAIAIAYVLNIPMKLIEEKVLAKNKLFNGTLKKFKRGIAILLTLISIVLIVIGITIFVVPQFTTSLTTLVNSVSNYSYNFDEILSLNGTAANVLNNLVAEVLVMWKEITQVLCEITANLFTEILSLTIGLTKSVVNGFIATILAIYMLFSKEAILVQIKRIITAFIKKDKVDFIMEIASIANLKFSKFIQGQCIEAVIISGLCFIGMLLLGMPYALLISVIIGVTALIPIFGAFIGTIPSVFIIFTVNPMQALWFIIFIIVVQQIEGNLIYPRVVGNSIGLSAIWVIFATLLGGGLFGIKGILIGIPLVGVIYTVFNNIVDKKINELV